MNIDQASIESIVKDVMNRLDSRRADSAPSLGVFESMSDAIGAAAAAQRKYLDCAIADRVRFVDTIRQTALKKENLEFMSRSAVEETGMGNYEHKLIKNRLAAEKTPGVEDLTTDAISGDDGLTIVEYSPFGVIGAITPTTNPTETIISNAIGMLAAGNSVVFSPHPRATKISIWLIRELNAALARVGAPLGLITTVFSPSIENTQLMMNDDRVRMLVATGGPGIVKAVLSSGKKAIGAGAGNPPVVVDETADIEKAAKDIIDGCSFDNNIPCTAEKEVIVVDSAADYLIFNMQKCGAFELTNQSEVDRLADIVMNDRKSPKTEFVGKSAKYILDKVGIASPDSTRVIITQTGEEHPFVQTELMMPILPIVRVADADEAIAMALRVEHGNRHTAMMHSKNVDRLTKMAKLIQTTIFVKNGPSYAGLGVGGMGYATFTIAGPTGEGLTSAKNFARRRRCVLVGGMDIR